MAKSTQFALQWQLQRESAHIKWLEQHVPQSTPLARCKGRVHTLAAKYTAEVDAKQKKRCESNAFLSLV